MKFIISFSLFLLIQLTAFSQLTYEQQLQEKEKELAQVRISESSLVAEIEGLKLNSIIEALKKVGYPESDEELEIVEHSAMVIGYNAKHKQAAWVFHKLIPDVSFGSVTRTNDFRPDPKLKSGSAVEADYFLKYEQEDGSFKYDGFGFDRGHLAPSADFRWSEKALSESYFYSNMTPQRAGFNRESWAEVEDILRSIVDNEKSSFYVLTGPVLTDDLPVVNRSVNKVSIPELHYKIIVDLASEQPKGMAFLMPNKKADYPAGYYVVSIDSVESITGLNFFPLLDDEMENLIEAESNYQAWNVDKNNADFAPIHPEKLPKGLFNTVQAKYHEGRKISVVGQVVSTKHLAKSQATFLNLDQSFPNQIFSVTIWKDGRKNFSYKPEEFLDGKKIVVTGKIQLDKDGIPTINVTNEKQIELWEDVM